MKRLYLFLAAFMLISSVSFAQVAKQPENLLQNLSLTSKMQSKALKSQAATTKSLAKEGEEATTNPFSVNSTLSLSGYNVDQAEVIDSLLIPANQEIANVNVSITGEQFRIAQIPTEGDITWESSIEGVSLENDTKILVKYIVPTTIPTEAITSTITITDALVSENTFDVNVTVTLETPTVNIPVINYVAYHEEPATVKSAVTFGTDETANGLTITLTCETVGATIYYTTDGTNPVVEGEAASSVYQDGVTAIRVQATTTVKAIATKEGYNNSEMAELEFTLNLGTCPTPTITGEEVAENNNEEENEEENEETPVASKASENTFQNSMTITIAYTGEPAEAQIYYYLNAAEVATLYEGPFNIDATTTIRAYVAKENWTNSEIAEATFTKEEEPVVEPLEAPVITFVAELPETVEPATEVSAILNIAAKDYIDELCMIQYSITKDGEPYTLVEGDEFKYSVRLAETEIHTANVTEASGIIAPTVEYEGNNYAFNAFTLGMFENSTCVNRNRPITLSAKFANEGTYVLTYAIHTANVENATVVEVHTFQDCNNLTHSDKVGTDATLGEAIVSQSLSISVAVVPPAVAKPTFTPAAGEYTEAQNVTIATTTEGATIKYAFGVLAEDTEWLDYSEALVIAETTTINAKAVLGADESAIATAEYVINIPVVTPAVAMPTFTPAAGEYTEAQNVTIATTTEGATIKYAFGVLSEDTEWLDYSEALVIAETTTINAKAVLGADESDIATAEYVINIPVVPTVETPVITGTDGATTFEANIQVTITCATEGAAIYYTTDNSEPTAESTLYEAAFTITETTIVKAIAVKDSMQNSEIANVTFTKVGANVAWSCDFETEGTFVAGNDSETGLSNWVRVSKETYPEDLGADGEGWFLQAFIANGDTLNETPGHWALVNLISNCSAAPINGPGIKPEVAWMEFNLNCEEVAAAPKLCFNQIYRPLNLRAADGAGSFIEVSTNGGASWVQYPVNQEVAANDYGKLRKEVVLDCINGQREVKIRFVLRAPGTASNGLEGYGWNVDDIKLVPTPDVNFTISEARISMYGYVDYRNVPPEYWTNITDPAERRDFAYQLSDPYAQSPRQNWVSSNSFAAFNVEILNEGLMTLAPKVNVKVVSPSGNVIYDQYVTGRELSALQGDTLDFGTIGETAAETNIFFFDVEDVNSIELGEYTVLFEVASATGEENADTTRNRKVQTFFITDNNYSTAYDEPDASFTFAGYTVSASGDEYGTEFTYFYEPEEIMRTDVFIDDRTTPGTAIQVKCYEANEEGDNINKGSSSILNVTEEMLGTWVTLDFEDEYEVRFPEGQAYHQVLVTVRGIWEGDEDIYLGANKELVTRGHNSLGSIPGMGDGWYYGFDPLAIRFYSDGNVSAPTFVMEDITMYPNPTSGIVNFENVEGATIEVINVMGQVVATVNANSNNASMDLSGISNGNYVVRIVKDGNIATSKLNIVR